MHLEKKFHYRIKTDLSILSYDFFYFISNVYLFDIEHFGAKDLFNSLKVLRM